MANKIFAKFQPKVEWKGGKRIVSFSLTSSMGTVGPNAVFGGYTPKQVLAEVKELLGEELFNKIEKQITYKDGFVTISDSFEINATATTKDILTAINGKYAELGLPSVFVENIKPIELKPEQFVERIGHDKKTRTDIQLKERTAEVNNELSVLKPRHIAFGSIVAEGQVDEIVTGIDASFDKKTYIDKYVQQFKDFGITQNNVQDLVKLFGDDKTLTVDGVTITLDAAEIDNIKKQIFTKEVLVYDLKPAERKAIVNAVCDTLIEGVENDELNKDQVQSILDNTTKMLSYITTQRDAILQQAIDKKKEKATIIEGIRNFGAAAGVTRTETTFEEEGITEEELINGR